MKKLSILIAAGLLSSTLYAAQAQAGTISWCFSKGCAVDDNATPFNNGIPVPYMESQGTIDINGTTSQGPKVRVNPVFIINENADNIFPSLVEGNTTGLGIGAIGEFFNVDRNPTTTEVLNIDVSVAINFANNNYAGGSWFLVLINADTTPLSSDTVVTVNDDLRGVFEIADQANLLSLGDLTDGSLLVAPDKSGVKFQLNSLIYQWDTQNSGGSGGSARLGETTNCNGPCPIIVVKDPEPGMLGLLGLSLAGLAYIRSKKQA